MLLAIFLVILLPSTLCQDEIDPNNEVQVDATNNVVENGLTETDPPLSESKQILSTFTKLACTIIKFIMKTRDFQSDLLTHILDMTMYSTDSTDFLDYIL